MHRLGTALVVVALVAATFVLAAERVPPATVDSLATDFERYSGAKLVFTREALPPGTYHDILLPLAEERRLNAATIALREIQKYPPRFLERIGLEAIGVFEACASREGDGFRPYDKALGGYRYFGIWNGASGVAAAYYTDEQLPLTIHHEVFHHVDGTRGTFDPAKHFAGDDAAFTAALAGTHCYPPLVLTALDREALRKASRNQTLEAAVSDYASKNPGEDQAETARYLLSHLPDALLQAAERPELPGSQRILHVLGEYAAAVDGGPAPAWFIDIALGRASTASTPGESQARELAALAEQLRADCRGEPSPADLDATQRRIRDSLDRVARLDARLIGPSSKIPWVTLAAEATEGLMRHRTQPTSAQKLFVIHGTEDASGVNWTLRADLAAFGNDATRLAVIARADESKHADVLRACLANLGHLGRYYRWMTGRWHVTDGTRAAFEETRRKIVEAMPKQYASLAAQLRHVSLTDLEPHLSTKNLAAAASSPAKPPENPFLVKVDAAIGTPRRRAAIRAVQPACVRIGQGSGVCVAANGMILTAAHVAGQLGNSLRCQFPDGREFFGPCVVINHHLDLALVDLHANGLPTAPVAGTAPAVRSWVCCIGQPGQTTPSGEPTDYEAWHVSTGAIRGFLPDPLGPQALGRAKHDAWTYWGHSGSPLFNERGEIVAMHNSWDSTTAMRHAVPHEAIVWFLQEAKLTTPAAK